MCIQCLCLLNKLLNLCSSAQCTAKFVFRSYTRSYIAIMNNILGLNKTTSFNTVKSLQFSQVKVLSNEVIRKHN